MLDLKGMFSRPGIFNKMSRILEPQPQTSLVSALTQLENEHNAEMSNFIPSI
jgi:hypothetical protein